jgi:hypothetical protein
MPNYFGFHVKIKDAYLMFGENYQKTFDEIIIPWNDTRHMDHYLCEKLSMVAESISNASEMPSIDVFYVGNERCVVGRQLNKISGNVNDFIVTLINLQIEFAGITNYFRIIHDEKYGTGTRSDTIERLFRLQPSVIEYKG